MSYSNANLVGLIEIDTGLSVSPVSALQETEDTTLGQSLARLAGIAHDEESPRSPRYATQFLRADLEQLKGELEMEFQSMLQRLFEQE